MLLNYFQYNIKKRHYQQQTKLKQLLHLLKIMNTYLLQSKQYIRDFVNFDWYGGMFRFLLTSHISFELTNSIRFLSHPFLNKVMKN